MERRGFRGQTFREGQQAGGQHVSAPSVPPLAVRRPQDRPGQQLADTSRRERLGEPDEASQRVMRQLKAGDQVEIKPPSAVMGSG